MIPLVQLLKFKGAGRSHSIIIDFNQIYVRNLLLFGFGLCMARQFSGPDIICHIDTKSIDALYINTKCFINGTMTLPTEQQDNVIYHNYYQWVSIVLLIMILTFYFPFAVWSRCYGYYLRQLNTNVKDIDACKRIEKLVKDSKGNYFFWKTFALEMIYAVHLLLHVYLLDLFFNQIWSKSGWSWNAIPQIFPETGSCHVDYYTGGALTTGKFICLLPLNIMFRKVFSVLYGVVIFSIALHILSFLYRIILVIRLGRKLVDIWWSFHIAQCCAETWEVRQALKKRWRSIYYPRMISMSKSPSLEETYIEMKIDNKG